jgi:hypothetical protein
MPSIKLKCKRAMKMLRIKYLNLLTADSFNYDFVSQRRVHSGKIINHRREKMMKEIKVDLKYYFSEMATFEDGYEAIIRYE